MLTVAYATSDGIVVDEHFGSCQRFDIYQLSAGSAALLESRKPVPEATDKIDARVSLVRDCAIVQMTSIGGPAAARITRAGVHPLLVVPGTPIETLNARLRAVLAGKPPPWLRRLARDRPRPAPDDDHPCYSEQAGKYARMHVPVAPGCNIQCHYCNRKFDCSSESRPGVTSALLTPEGALERVAAVVRRLPQLRVVGVAGPGEPLANAARTFRTLALVGQRFPDLRLCLSTNGLTLLDHVDRIVELGIRHVTITINMIDPEIGSRIYPWITFRGHRYTGVTASRILSERQLDGLLALADRDIRCKINSVLIPGINDRHLAEVSRAVKQRGATVYNVMPLASRPEYGSHYGRSGQREPSSQELALVRDQCETDGELAVMRHCRRCRADAIGFLGTCPGTASITSHRTNSDQGGVAQCIDGVTSDQSPVLSLPH